MVLGPKGPGRVGRRQAEKPQLPMAVVAFYPKKSSCQRHTDHLEIAEPRSLIFVNGRRKTEITECRSVILAKPATMG
jgi:hypothetical protein